ncbi:DUF300-domain-containing protein [Polychaeton citri CBS 116435]|uniref:DUF300-domain-containing protein n=1 Tax=Polychaeton citri CBS 116435 TaxID=1314669 RepID=A0A9P4QE00_9PEZI|nr:DUF300-domain-containing protein [Polychaeton citri CBS 116435]
MANVDASPQSKVAMVIDAVAALGDQSERGGTGSGFGRIVLILTGVAALVACIITFASTFLQFKNYRKPLLQRHVIRIFMLVPIFSAASWASLTSLQVAFWIDPFRDVYEAFTLYTFFQLLVNFLGGERSLIILMHGRRPVDHLWPLNHVLGKVDISDPHTFLSVKRGILQYVWIKPVLAVATIAMKATGTFREGIIAVDSGYFWTSLIYNVSICWSLYDLALFWVCMTEDLQPFRPMPKFLCIKGIIFASWWQGFFLSILVWLGAITSSTTYKYTADNLAAAIQDALICFEMPFFALSHWYAFSWKDYADKTISEARLPIRYALRDAFGPKDLIEDARETWRGDKYEYRYFDAGDNVMAHEESSSRRRRMQEGLRYERNGRGKYWIPKPGTERHSDAKQPLLQKLADGHNKTMVPPSGGGGKTSRDSSRGARNGYGTNRDGGELEEPELDPSEERLYGKARELEFGDWNYPVINTRYASHDDALHGTPNIITNTTNRSLLQPTRDNRQRRRSQIKSIQEGVHQHNNPSRDSKRKNSRSSSSAAPPSGKGSDKGKKSSVTFDGAQSRADRNPSPSSTSSSASKKSHSSQLVDLVVEDFEAEAVERVRARKEGGPGWNSVDAQKHFVQTYPDADDGDGDGEEVRQGFNPDRPHHVPGADGEHSLSKPLGVGVVGDEGEADNMAEGEERDEAGRPQPWDRRSYEGEHHGDDREGRSPFEEEREAWGGR